MQVTNKCLYAIIAFGWHKKYGYSDDVTILPGQSANISGPYIGEMGGGDCYISLDGEITCHEQQDDENGFYVSRGNQLTLGSGEKGVTIRHPSDDRKFG